MTRKQAIIVLLGAASGVQVSAQEKELADCVKNIPNADRTNVSVDYSACPERKITALLRITLQDPKYSRSPWEFASGIDSIEVEYNGETKRISASEIWEALR